MCVWNVSPGDRLCQYCSYVGGCEKHKTTEMLVAEAKAIVERMNELVGADVSGRSQKGMMVPARHFVAYELRMRGYSLPVIGAALGRTHASVMSGIERAKLMLEYHALYPQENKLWNQFKTNIAL